MTETRQLLAQYADTGSEAAFRELVDRYINLVYATSVRLVDGDRHLAEDVTQTVFADLARSAHTVSREAQLGGWLHRHACFIAAKTLRGDRRRRWREKQAAEMSKTPDHSADVTSPAIQDLDEAINQLRESDRTAVLLRFFEQRDFRGVGEGLGISEEAARKRVTRALEELHVRLSRRGVAATATALGAFLAADVVTSAPTGLSAGVATSALAKVSEAGATLAATKFLTMANMKPIAITVAALAVITVPLLLQHRTEVNLRHENQALRAQLEPLAQLQANNETLSNQLARMLLQPPPAADEHHELLHLRGEVGLLRDQSNELQNLRKELATLQSRPPGSTSSKEVADISYHLPGLPIMQLFSIYEKLCGKKLTASPDVDLGQSVRILTQRKLTKSEAMLVIEQAFIDQAHVKIVPADDGNLSVVPAP